MTPFEETKHAIKDDYQVIVLRNSYAHGELFENKETAVYFAKGYVGKEGVHSVSVVKGENEVYKWIRTDSYP